MGTSSKYLNSILKILPAIQARQITDLLNELQSKGEVSTPDEYTKKLYELSRLINDKAPKPSFEQIRALVWDLCSSEAHNIMMRSAQNDIEAIFEQTNEMGEKLEDHHFLMMKNLIADLERGLKEQETVIRQLEWLANQSNEFTSALVNSFKSSSLLRLPRSIVGAENFYFDNRTYKNILVKDIANAVVSERGQKLLLDTSNDPRILPLSVVLLSDDNSYGTSVNVDLNNPIENIIDGTIGTFWTRNVYLPTPVEKVTTVLKFDIGTAKDINYLIVEGATAAPFIIEQVVGLSPDGHEQILANEEIEVSGKYRINFERTLLRAVKITFTVKSYDRGEYTVDPMSSLHTVLDTSDKTTIERADALAPLVKEVLTSEKLIKVCNVPKTKYERINSYIYSFSLDNVWFGNSLYQDQGIFVSAPLSVKNIGVLGVQGKEKTETGIVRNSIEYEIIKVDSSLRNREKRFSIPNLGQTEVKSERLVLTKKSNSLKTINDYGVLRFCPYVVDGWIPTLDSPISVYRNGQLLQINNDYEIAISKSGGTGPDQLDWKSSFIHADDFSKFTLNPQKMWIKILTPSSNSVYTVDYTLRFSTDASDSQTVWLDSDKTIYLASDSRVHFKDEDPDADLDSKIYLQITLRRNKSSQSDSPELYEYAILASSFKKEEVS